MEAYLYKKMKTNLKATNLEPKEKLSIWAPVFSNFTYWSKVVEKLDIRKIQFNKNKKQENLKLDKFENSMKSSHKWLDRSHVLNHEFIKAEKLLNIWNFSKLSKLSK